MGNRVTVEERPGVPAGDVEVLTVTDMHTAGEPVRILTGGAPELRGETILEKRRDARDRLDHIRRRLMLEPRGHADMYGVWPTRPSHPDAALAVLFMHNEGYSTMCGHATIALGRWVIDQGLVAARSPETSFVLECPCGPVTVRSRVDADGRVGPVAFDSVPAFAAQLDVRLRLQGHGDVTVDIAYGGAFYAIVPASRLGLDLHRTPYETLVAAGRLVTEAGREQLAIEHPREPDLGFLYGTLLVDDTPPRSTDPSYNVCVFGGGQVDRSPTGSGATARMALYHARGELGVGEQREFRGISGVGFSARIQRIEDEGVIVEVSGQGYYSGESRLVFERGDQLVNGFSIFDLTRPV
jgi:trans-L-3-hydroxyproline dehydratase